jgi:dihydrofolate reductase
MKTSVFVGVSVDGYLARKNHELDFLPVGGGEPHGYVEFMASVDVLVIGRHTYETVLAFDEWPYAGKRVVVLSSHKLDLSAVQSHAVEQMSGTPEQIVRQLESQGLQHAYIDGGITIQRFLREGLIRHLTITRVPVLIGDGISLFGSLLHDVQLQHLKTTTYQSGLVKSEYDVLG